MPPAHHDEARDYGFADLALALRERAGLTQADLAALLGVSKRAVQTWEAGTSYPGAERLRQLIALYLARGTFGPGQEEGEASALWEAAAGKATRHLVPFNPRWFASLRRVDGAAVAVAPLAPTAEAILPPPRHDWGEVPDASAFYGRTEEVATLTHWLLVDRCRLIGVLGMGGIGKTLLAAHVAREAAPEFAVVYWRSLRNAPPVEEWLAGAIAAFSPAHTLPAGGVAERLALLLELLQTRRGLLVMDNLETILEPGASEARYRLGYAGYGEVLRRVGESIHQGCLLVTGREAPPGLAPLTDERAPVRTLRLGGLLPAAGRALLQERGLVSDDAASEALIAHFSGNPLALRMVGETIGVVFGGDIAAFLAQEAMVFGGVRQLLDEQVGRLSSLELAIGTWLAVEREPIGFAELVADLGPEVVRGEVVEAVEALARRSLLERGSGGTFTLQPVVLEYATMRLIEAIAQEILAGQPALLVRYALLKAHAKEYVRHSQERLIAQPLLDRLSTNYSTPGALERQLLALLEAWREREAGEQGYGPGNVVNLLRLLRGELRGLDLSRLALRHAYLHGVNAQDTSLAHAHLSGVVLAELFNFPLSVAFDADSAHLAVGTSTGEIYQWRIADRTLLLALHGRTNAAPAMALSADGRVVASSAGGTVTLWATAAMHPEAPRHPVPGSGRPLATLQGHAESVWCLALSADGRVVACGNVDGAVTLWETALANGTPGRLLATLHGPAGMVWSVALSADGRWVACGSHDGTITLWETAPASGPPGRLLATLQGHAGGVLAVALSADGRWVAGGSHDGTVTLWEATPASGPPERPVATLQGRRASAIRCLALSGDGRLVAGGCQDGSLALWETAPASGSPGRPLATLEGYTGAIRGVALSADGRLAAGSRLDGTVTLWEVAPSGGPPGRSLATLQGHASAVRCVALSGDGRLAAGGCQDGSLALWEVAPASGSPWRLLATLRGHSGMVWSVALSGDGRLLASGGEDGTVRLWDTTPTSGYPVPGSGQALAILQGHAGAVWGVALSGDGRLLASGSQDKTARLWETAPASGSPGRLLATLEGHTSSVSSVALSEDGRLLASASYDGTVRLWAIAPVHPEGPEYAGPGLLTILQGHTGAVRGVALSGDGRLLASASYDGTVKLWKVAPAVPSATQEGGSFQASEPSGGLLATLWEHVGGVLDVALSGDGMVAASGGWDGTLKLWDTGSTKDHPIPGSGASLRTLRDDRCYERMDITGLTGVTEAQRAVLLALGAVERAPSPPTTAPSPPATAIPPSASDPTPEPAVARPSTPPTNLPPARTSFVGRASELEALTQALDPSTRPDARLITLSGVAGSGKTRLAMAAAGLVREGYEQGVWLVELASLPASPSGDPTPVAAATLSALDLSEQPGQDPLDTLVAHLRPGCLLLVLDNCEHLVAATAALAARLLAASPELRILATSQHTLGIAGEVDWRVATLGVPPRIAEAPTPEVLRLLGQSDAVQLFVQRAQAVQPGFVLSAATAPDVVAICQRLDGLPLAIELAAARLNVLPAAEILARLDDRFHLLRRGGRAAPDRHQALQAAMDWSYGLLDPAEQAVLRRLSVFAGGWELAAAEAVCQGPLWGRQSPTDVEGGSLRKPAEIVSAHDVLSILDELLDRSLVYVRQLGGTPRYGMLETVRHYGLQQLERVGEAETLRDRHLAWCVTLAEQGARGLLGPEQAAWLGRLEREHDDMRAALQWALDRDLAVLGLRLAAELWQFWRGRRNHLRQGRRWLTALLAMAADEDEDDPTTMAIRAGALEGAAWLAEDEHDFAEATALLAQSAALRRALGVEQPQTGELVNAAMEARAGGDYARATGLLEESLAKHRAAGSRESIKRGGLGLSLSRLALVLAEQGAYERATALYEECLALHRALGDQEGIGSALLGLGDIARDQGDTARVRAYCEETLALFEELGHNWVGFSLNNLALAAYLDGDLALASRRAAESMALFRDLQAGPSLAEVLVTAGRIKGAQGEATAARADLGEALTLAWAHGPRLVVAAALDEIGLQAVRKGHALHGVQILGAATALRGAMGTPVRPCDRPAREGSLATARVSLGETTFARAWGTGQSLPLDQLVARALSGPEDAIDPAAPAHPT